MFTIENYYAAQSMLESKSLGLMGLDNKQIAKTGFPPEFYSIYPIYGRVFYTCAPNTFQHIIFKGVLVEALSTYPERFGTGDAYDVVEAVRLVYPSFDTTERHADFLKSEQFCFIMENTAGLIQDKVLRIDLFREIKENPEGKKEFVGGIMHAFKHFSYEGINLSTGNDLNDIASPENIIGLTIKAFFMPEDIEETAKGFIGRITLDDKYWLKFSFYLEQINGVHFINTIHKERKKLPH